MGDAAGRDRDHSAVDRCDPQSAFHPSLVWASPSLIPPDPLVSCREFSVAVGLRFFVPEDLYGVVGCDIWRGIAPAGEVGASSAMQGGADAAAAAPGEPAADSAEAEAAAKDAATAVAVAEELYLRQNTP